MAVSSETMGAFGPVRSTQQSPSCIITYLLPYLLVPHTHTHPSPFKPDAGGSGQSGEAGPREGVGGCAACRSETWHGSSSFRFCLLTFVAAGFCYSEGTATAILLMGPSSLPRLNAPPGPPSVTWRALSIDTSPYNRGEGNISPVCRKQDSSDLDYVWMCWRERSVCVNVCMYMCVCVSAPAHV